MSNTLNVINDQAIKRLRYLKSHKLKYPNIYQYNEIKCCNKNSITELHLNTKKKMIMKKMKLNREAPNQLPVTCYLSLSREGRWGTAEATWANFLHSSLLFACRKSASPPSPVHSLMLSAHVFLGLPLPLLPGTVPCKIVFAKPLLLVT